MPTEWNTRSTAVHIWLRRPRQQGNRPTVNLLGYDTEIQLTTGPDSFEPDQLNSSE